MTTMHPAENTTNHKMGMRQNERSVSSPTSNCHKKVPVNVGHDGALAESMPFDRRFVGPNPALAATLGPWASPSLTVARSASACKLRQCQLLWSGALLKGSCCEKRYRNG